MRVIWTVLPLSGLKKHKIAVLNGRHVKTGYFGKETPFAIYNISANNLVQKSTVSSCTFTKANEKVYTSSHTVTILILSYLANSKFLDV